MLLSGETWVERFHAAHTPAQAYELAQRYEPHVAMVDLMLGGESGADVCERIRELSPTTRVLLMFGVERRSEERRVGKECRSRWSPHHQKKKLQYPTITIHTNPG